MALWLAQRLPSLLASPQVVSSCLCVIMHNRSSLLLVSHQHLMLHGSEQVIACMQSHLQGIHACAQLIRTSYLAPHNAGMHSFCSSFLCKSIIKTHTWLTNNPWRRLQRLQKLSTTGSGLPAKHQVAFFDSVPGLGNVANSVVLGD